MLTTTRAHLLLQVDPGRQEEVAAYLDALPQVTEAVVTSGPYDVIATVCVPDEHELSVTVRKARRSPGLAALRLCRQAGSTAPDTIDLTAH